MLMPVRSAPSSRPSRTPPDRKPSGSASSYWNSGDAMLIRRIAEPSQRRCHNAGMPTKDTILEALKVVIDPELRRDIVELGMVRSIDVKDGGVVDVTVSLTTPGCPIKNHFQTAVADAVRGVDGVAHVNVGFDVLTDAEKSGLQRKLGRPGGLPEGALAEVANVICIGSGKGGVGKSSLTVNLAAALSAEGKRVGVLDADVWGYSIPRMLGLGGERPKVSAQRKILPLEAHGLKVMSI